jgi:hypothetical protein
MKKSLIIIALVMILSFNVISALDLSISKTQYYPGETLQVEIPDVFIGNLQQTNFGIYRADGVHKMPSESGLMKSEGKYYFYAILPELVGDYLLKIENIAYYENNLQIQEAISKNFSIVRANVSYLSFDPGQVLTASDFSITIKAYGESQTVSVELPATGFKQSFNLGLGADKKVYFSIAGVTGFVKSMVKINSYTLPVIIAPVVGPANNTDLIPANISIFDLIEIMPKEINATVMEKMSYDFKIILLNKFGQPLFGVSILPSDKSISINTNNTDIPGDKKEINLTILSQKDLIGNINITYRNSSIILPISIIVTKNQSQVIANIPPVNLIRTCKENNGAICNITAGQSCNGIEQQALDGICCLAECTVKSASYSWIWGIVLIIFLGLGGWLIYKKYQQKPSEERSEELIKKRAEDYKERISPPIEVKKSLEKD